MEPGFAPGRVPRTEFLEPTCVPRPYHHDVARPDLHILGSFCGDELLCPYLITRFDPGGAPQSRDVDQNPPADDAVPSGFHIAHSGAVRSGRRIWGAAEQSPAEADVGQRVEMALTVVVVVGPDEVLDEADAPGAILGELRHTVNGGYWIVGPSLRVQRQSQTDGLTGTHQPGRGHDTLRGQEVERAPGRRPVPSGPVRHLVEERVELGCRHRG